ncbi:putative kinase inhibitor [Fusobacterium necrogenes]|uniref:Putative kinase inhibitor n=1 Tax=Fusobacterium necrogenes TaxID=858 RepID=A0A377GVU5_9FUSO|nr:YbhB/YbcL family Raf kinase inhibitor-like protein [Fusobacterium necrogenes]STO31117.1 putative kinase inhibitor [Fusobacterium necrogenes]
MKKNLIAGALLLGASAFGFELTSSGIENGFINEKYGRYGSENINGMPSLSLPLEWKEAPKGTKSFALVMEDYDAVPVTGFSWIHWIAIIPGNYNKLEENASLTNKDIIQGVNSWVSSMGGLSKADASHFGGPAPPDKDHTYKFVLYALDKEIKLESGFYLNELYKEMEGHILNSTELEGIYKVK